MAQHSIKAEDDRVSSTVQWAKVAAISALGSLLFLVVLQPAIAQQVCAGVGVGMASGTSTVACGNAAVANGAGTTAVGFFAGFNSNDPESFSNTFLGAKSGTQVVGDDNTAVGTETGSQVKGKFNAAFGGQAGVQVTGDLNFAAVEGAGSRVNGSFNVAIGVGAGSNVNGNGDVAIGSNTGSGTSETPLVGSNTVAIGDQAVATADGAVAIGYGARAKRANQFVFGTANSTYSIPGIASPASRAAMNGPVQIVSSDADGNLVTNTAAGLDLATISDLNVIRSELARLYARLKELEERIQKSAR
jgi:trimeric autotransporter adhesin